MARYLPQFRPAVVAAVLLLTPHLSGALWLPYDLNSLVALSDAIVLAERIGTRPVTGSYGRIVTLTRYRVKKVYRGALLPGREIELLDNYRRTDPYGKPMQFDGGAIVFLQKSDSGRPWSLRALSEKDIPRLSITHSGLRLLAKGKVYTFLQFNNPGPVCPTPLRRWFFPSGKSEDVTVKEFERDLRDSILRVETFRQAKLEKDPGKRRQQIIALLKPYEEEAERAGQHELNWLGPANVFLQEIADFFLESGDLEGALEVFARTGQNVALKKEVALSAAANAAIAPHLRVAAVRRLEWTLFDEQDAIAALSALLEDANPDVRGTVREKLLWLNRGYRMNDHMHTPALTRLWTEVLGRIKSSTPKASSAADKAAGEQSEKGRGSAP